jgi:uncharacterized protein (UPF0335 family)
VIVLENHINEEKGPVALGKLIGMLKKLPRLDEELDSFAEDIEDIWTKQPHLPKRNIISDNSA